MSIGGLTSTPHTVGEKIRWARTRAGLSLDRLGEAVGTSRQHLIRLESGKHVPRADLLERIAEATGQEPAFFGESAEDQRLSRDRNRAKAEAARDLMDALMRVVEMYDEVPE